MARPRVQSRDKWRSKVWYQILAPEAFGEKEVGETPASDPKKVIDRIIRVPVSDLTGNHRQGNMYMFFKVDKVVGTLAKTKFSGFEVARTFLHSIVRRNREKIDSVQDWTTKDGVKLRMKTVMMTVGSCHSKQKTVLRNIMEDLLKKEVESSDFDTVLKQIIDYVPQRAIKKAASVIYPVANAEIRKIELL